VRGKINYHLICNLIVYVSIDTCSTWWQHFAYCVISAVPTSCAAAQPAPPDLCLETRAETPLSLQTAQVHRNMACKSAQIVGFKHLHSCPSQTCKVLKVYCKECQTNLASIQKMHKHEELIQIVLQQSIWICQKIVTKSCWALCIILCRIYKTPRLRNTQTCKGVPVRRTRWFVEKVVRVWKSLESLFFKRWPSSTIWMK